MKILKKKLKTALVKIDPYGSPIGDDTCKKLEPRVGVTHRPVYISGPFQGGGGVMRLRSGRRLVNILPSAQRTRA